MSTFKPNNFGAIFKFDLIISLDFRKKNGTDVKYTLYFPLQILNAVLSLSQAFSELRLTFKSI